MTNNWDSVTENYIYYSSTSGGSLQEASVLAKVASLFCMVPVALPPPVQGVCKCPALWAVQRVPMNQPHALPPQTLNAHPAAPHLV
eukprot:3385829-Rhodomonas_salina.1